jgi:hypothetical protein
MFGLNLLRNAIARAARAFNGLAEAVEAMTLSIAVPDDQPAALPAPPPAALPAPVEAAANGEAAAGKRRSRRDD